MRTQDEILKMIRLLRESKADPSMVQQRTLFHKLEWKNAIEFIHPSKRTHDLKQKFESMNKSDEASLRGELVERMDQLFSFLSDGDVTLVHIHLQMILVYLWLLREETLFQWLLSRLGYMNMNWRSVSRHIADEIGIDWKILELRYP